MTEERFLVTGALGCIGAWTCALLAGEGVDVVGFDFGTDDRRLRLATDAEIRPYWLALIERNRSSLVDPANPDLIFPGQVFQLPRLPDPPPG